MQCKRAPSACSNGLRRVVDGTTRELYLAKGLTDALSLPVFPMPVGGAMPAAAAVALTTEEVAELRIELGVHRTKRVREAMAEIEAAHDRAFALAWLPKAMDPTRALAWLDAHGEDDWGGPPAVGGMVAH